MSEPCADCGKKDEEIKALRLANDGLRRRVREMEAHSIEVEARVLAQYARYDSDLAGLRTAVAAARAKEALALKAALAEVATTPGPA